MRGAQRIVTRERFGVWSKLIDCATAFNGNQRAPHDPHMEDRMSKSAQEEWDDERILMQSEGVKFDGDKLRYDLLPPELLEETARVLTYGAVKYSERNWEKGMAWHRPFGALMRHMWAWWGGQDNDPETGYSHLAHAACCIAFLISYERRAIGTDDRHKLGE